MTGIDYALSALVAVICGLDRTAAFQFMIARPIVAGPLTGLVLGEPLAGLQVGFLLELLWIGRLPVGASIPPDDTQVAVAGTFLAVFSYRVLGIPYASAGFLALLIAMPIGKVGQLFDHASRTRNKLLINRVESMLDQGRTDEVEQIHRRGLVRFGCSSLATFICILIPGICLVFAIGGLLAPIAGEVENWLWLAFPLVGAGVLIGTINVKRAMTLFGTSFVGALLMLWLV